MLDRRPAAPRFPLRRFGTAVSAGILTLGVSAAALAAPATAASAARANPDARVRVSQGIGAAALAGATPLQPTPPGTAMTVSFVLKAVNLSGLEAAVAAGWHAAYLSVARFAAQYGQPPATVAALQAYLRGFGISSSADTDNLEVTATGTAAQFNQALQVTLRNYAVPAVAPMRPPPPAATGPAPRTEVVHGTQADPSLPADLASSVLSILGLSNYGPFVSQALPALRPAGAPAPGPAGGGIPAGELTPANYESLYDVTPLEDAGDLGQSRTIGIVTLASLDPGVPETFWTRYLHLDVVPNKISLVNVDGGAGAVSLANGSAETTLDVEQAGAIAPQARVVVYQAPNTDYGFVDAFFTAVSQDAAGSLSTSWGESETAITAAVLAGQESQTYAQCFTEAFLEAAAQGEATFVAAGDFGAYDAAGDIGTTNLSVDSPADNPYATAAGGTTLPGTQTYTYTPPSGSAGAVTESVTVPAQRTWGWNYLWPLYAAFGVPSEATFALEAIGGSGGGYSAYFPTPAYQQGVPGVDTFSAVQYLTPDQPSVVDGLSLPTSWAFTASPGVTTGTGTGRAMPDLATDADPQTGYALYDPQFGPGPQAVQEYGGTSFVAPQLAGVTAVIDSALGVRVGFWNPAIYAFASTTRSPFTPLDATGATNNNLYYSGSPAAVFNPGSGLGYPDVAALAADFASLVPAGSTPSTPSSPPGPTGPGGPPGPGGSGRPGGPPGPGGSPPGGPGAASRPRP